MARAIWSGSLSFGLINIPVRMYSAEESKSDFDFNLLDKKTKSRIRYARVNRDTGEEVPYEDIVKGYEYQDGDYVILTENDFNRVNRDRQKTIDIKAFVAAKEIDPRFYKKPYHLESQTGAESAYALLRESLKRTKKVAVAKYVLRNRDHLAAIAPLGQALIMYELRFQNQIREPVGLNLPDAKATSEDQIKMAEALVEQLTKHFIPEDYHDSYSEDLRKLIDKKIKGQPTKAKGKEPTPTKAKDIMDLLKASLEKSKASS